MLLYSLNCVLTCKQVYITWRKFNKHGSANQFTGVFECKSNDLCYDYFNILKAFARIILMQIPNLYQFPCQFHTKKSFDTYL